MREETNEIWVQHGTTMSSQRDIFGIPIISDYLPYTIYDTCVITITMAITITNNYIFLRYWVGFVGYSSKQLFSKMGLSENAVYQYTMVYRLALFTGITGIIGVKRSQWRMCDLKLPNMLYPLKPKKR